ncbi:MAG: hypothetical protein PHU85_19005 [Phycisphaerae bacterium]|nr:hypothetical protein [Phycisphaerae bacterium]
MTDRAVRFAARIIAIGLLGVAWTIGTLALVLVQQAAEPSWRQRATAYAGLLPVGVLLLYVVLTDLADWRISRKPVVLDADDE